MGELGYAATFRELVVYRKSRAVASRVFELSKGFPKEERYSLTDQVRRSSRSVGAQIAEAWAKRRYERHFVSKLVDADGEQNETQHWVEVAQDCAYLAPEEAAGLLSELREVSRMLNSMIEKSDQFCSPQPGQVREADATYFVSSDEESAGE